jgi:hypothetical protein
MRVATAKAWMPKAGDEVTGTLVHVTGRTSEYGTYPVVYLEPVDKDGVIGEMIAIHAFHTTLNEGFKELAPARGSTVWVAYHGLKESRGRKDKDGKPVEYHHYTVLDPTAEVVSNDNPFVEGNEAIGF